MENSLRPIISSLWIGGPLSYLELLSLKSMYDWGHPVKLYHYRPLENVPSWLQTFDANMIMPVSTERLMRYASYPAALSDLFRYHLLAKTDEVWCDCDVYFMRPLENAEYIFAIERDGPVPSWSNGIMRLPRDCPVILDLLELFSTDTPTLPVNKYFFRGAKSRIEDVEAKGGNGNVHIADLPWAITGPRAFSYFLDKHQLGHLAWRREMHLPINEREISCLARPRASRLLSLPAMCHSIHYYGSSLRSTLVNRGVFADNEPFEGSFLSVRMKAHGIDPKAAPLQSSTGKKTHMKAVNQKFSSQATKRVS